MTSWRHGSVGALRTCSATINFEETLGIKMGSRSLVIDTLLHALMERLFCGQPIVSLGRGGDAFNNTLGDGDGNLAYPVDALAKQRVVI